MKSPLNSLVPTCCGQFCKVVNPVDEQIKSPVTVPNFTGPGNFGIRMLSRRTSPSTSTNPSALILKFSILWFLNHFSICGLNESVVGSDDDPVGPGSATVL